MQRAKLEATKTRRFYVMMRLTADEHAEFERVRAATGFTASELARRCFAVGKSIVESAMQPLTRNRELKL